MQPLYNHTVLCLVKFFKKPWCFLYEYVWLLAPIVMLTNIHSSVISPAFSPLLIDLWIPSDISHFTGDSTAWHSSENGCWNQLSQSVLCAGLNLAGWSRTGDSEGTLVSLCGHLLVCHITLQSFSWCFYPKWLRIIAFSHVDTTPKFALFTSNFIEYAEFLQLLH